MKKRGQAEVVGALILLGIVLVGGFASYKIVSENRYVGDLNSKIYYDLKTCQVESIPRENLINFNSLGEAIKNGYVPAPCSKK